MFRDCWRTAVADGNVKHAREWAINIERELLKTCANEMGAVYLRRYELQPLIHDCDAQVARFLSVSILHCFLFSFSTNRMRLLAFDDKVLKRLKRHLAAAEPPQSLEQCLQSLFV